ncbi:dipeptide ABC transporter ATP-binding protein [Oerskovia jenensis]|uniref:Peptide/nickel transport system ATP-binding protein n=1 Tax=Oerskovia jenensis TaxID=162169 RepID=A0ABS2LEB6_9CELL|nr:ABC transporter ATP-binding protein [Oerskovia jenensis]MBM7478763.1 peptide/nickel transport system ATP-binding protein [Oerskovia jenensis]
MSAQIDAVAGGGAAAAAATSAVALAETAATEAATAATAATAEHARSALLRVEGLSVAYRHDEVVHDVAFTVRRGESVALIGESGSGKSTIAKAVLRLLPQGATAHGTVDLVGQEVLALSDRQFRPLRGRTVGFVPQDPANALNAVRTVGAQAHEAAALLGIRDVEARKERILEVFAQVGLDDPERVYAAYPHHLSGGMLQRVLIGLAILPGPALLVADEPTSALDVTIQRRILDLLTELQSSLDLGVLLITHDLAIAAERADSLVVLRSGRVQETGPARTVLVSPRSEYTRRLHADVPALHPDRYRDLKALRRAAQDLPATQARPAAQARPPQGVKGRAATAAQIEFRAVGKTFTAGAAPVVAAQDVSFTVAAGRTHAIVGESGSGKTTAVRMLLGLEQPDSGDIRVGGESVVGRSRSDLRSLRRHLQLVYQNPFTSLDPTWRVSRIVREPLDRFGVGGRGERAGLVEEALTSVGLGDQYLARRPAALSGGQRQRVALARALVLRPDVIVLDEPTSALDVTVQADILDVLFRLQVEHGLTYLFVSHDLGLVRQVADTVTVLEKGRVVEQGAIEQVFADPQEPYTRALLQSIPRAR